MSWNRWFRPATVKFRIALGYALFFGCSFAAVFCAVFIVWSHNGRETIDNRIDFFCRLFEYEYLTGEEFSSNYAPTSPKRIPAALFRAIEEKIPGFSPLIFLKNTENEQRLLMLGFHDRALLRIDADSVSRDIGVRRIAFPPRQPTLEEEFNTEFYGESSKQFYFLLLDRRRNIISRSAMPEKLQQAFVGFDYQPDGTEPIHFSTFLPDRHPVRIGYRVLPDGNLLVVGANLHSLYADLDRLVVLFWIAGGVALCLGAIGGWLLAGKFVAGVDRVSHAAETIAAGDYSLRVPPGGEGREIARLTAAFNTMVGNTEQLLDELRNISDDIAHDLRTPLTRILGRAELAVSGKQELAAYQEAVSDIAEEGQRMLNLINLMLEVSRMESGAALTHPADFDFSEMLKHSVALFAMAAEGNGQTLKWELPDHPVTLHADPAKIRQLASNLLDNALKFTPPGGTISVCLREAGGEAVFTVSDTGCGIRPEDAREVFRRFFRADESRSLPGNGLGLSLVQAIAHVHGGSVTLASEPGRGSTFTVRLPRAH